MGGGRFERLLLLSEMSDFSLQIDSTRNKNAETTSRTADNDDIAVAAGGVCGKKANNNDDVGSVPPPPPRLLKRKGQEDKTGPMPPPQVTPASCVCTHPMLMGQDPDGDYRMLGLLILASIILALILRSLSLKI